MSADPQIRQYEKMIANDARQDERNLSHAVKDVSSADKAHNKGVKNIDKAEHNVDKAVKNEHKAAGALNKAHHNHEAAIADQQAAEKSLNLKQQHEARLAQDLQKRRATMEDFQHLKDNNDQQRELKLSQIHAQAASRAGSLDLGRPGDSQPPSATAGPEAGPEAGPGAGPAGANA